MDRVEVLFKHRTRNDIIRHKKTFETLTGVYFLIKDNEIVYIGSSENAYDRIQRHKTADNSQTFEDTYDSFYIIKCPKGDLEYLEGYYIIKFKPKYNKKTTSKGKELYKKLKHYAKDSSNNSTGIFRPIRHTPTYSLPLDKRG